MLEVLQFIFQDFWHFIGTLVLIESIVLPICEAVEHHGKNRKTETDTESVDHNAPLSGLISV